MSQKHKINIEIIFWDGEDGTPRDDEFIIEEHQLEEFKLEFWSDVRHVISALHRKYLNIKGSQT